MVTRHLRTAPPPVQRRAARKKGSRETSHALNRNQREQIPGARSSSPLATGRRYSVTMPEVAPGRSTVEGRVGMVWAVRIVLRF